MYRAVKGTITKICSVPGILKLTVNRSCVQKENKKQKEIFHLVDPNTKQRKRSLNFRI